MIYPGIVIGNGALNSNFERSPRGNLREPKIPTVDDKLLAPNVPNTTKATYS